MKRSLLIPITLVLATGVTRAEEVVVPLSEGAAPLSRRFELRLEEGAAATRLEVRGAGGPAAAPILKITPDREGRLLTIQAAPAPGETRRSKLVFRPAEKDARAAQEADAQGWRGRPMPGLLRLAEGRLQVWLEGRLIFNGPCGAPSARGLAIIPGKGGQFTWREEEKPCPARYETMELAHLFEEPGTKDTLRTVDGIPFRVRNGTLLSLRNAGWPEWASDPGSFVEAYDNASLLFWDRGGRRPIAEVPRADYVAAYLLATMDDEPGLSDWVTLRAGRRAAQVFYRDFGAAVPRGGGALRVIRIPFGEAFAQDVEGEVLDIEITKEIRLARRRPDPNRYRWRPLGLPSGVKIAAVTLEKSPVRMEVRPPRPGGALFRLPARAVFQVRLTNITAEARECIVRAEASPAAPDGAPASVTVQCHVPAGASVEKAVTLPELPPGYFGLAVSLDEAAAGRLFTYHTALGILPAGEETFRAEAPWGTWSFGGDHFTPEDNEDAAEVMRKLGLRYGLFKASPALRDRFGITKGNELAVITASPDPEKTPLRYAEALAKDPGYTPDLMLFHEDAISGPHATRVPDLFSDGPPYRLDAGEQARFARMVEVARSAAAAMRTAFPGVKIHLGNGGLPLREELYRAGFPSDCFDTAGNEAAAFGRPPETQPPDIIANNASLWMDRQLLDAYGYGGKEVSQCYEVIYPSTNPGNLSLQTQADYFVRNVLHSMAWKVPKIRFGGLADVGNSYYGSNWGASGLMTARPQWAPKPAALAVATMTRELDGAAYGGFLETGSGSAYLLRFMKKDGGFVHPFWVVRGERDLYLRVAAEGVRLVSAGGASREVPVRDGALSVTATASPQWLVLPPGSAIESVELGAPRYPGAEPRGKVSALSPFDSPGEWELVEGGNPLLDHYNPLTPRRHGRFTVERVAAFEGSGPALKVTPHSPHHGKATMPMYAELVCRRALPLPGKPAEIGLWVNGNSGWGRVIFELEDAAGQRWTSIGARAEEGSQWMADWLGSELNAGYKPGEIADWNTDDVFGLSRINFDGWRPLLIPLPGQYPGEGYPWPANSQWRSDGDGRVHYPLALRKVIVEMPEKTLYLTRFEPAPRPAIYLRNLISVEREMDAPKRTPGGYVDAAQMDLR